jgi:hypothetical protein
MAAILDRHGGNFLNLGLDQERGEAHPPHDDLPGSSPAPLAMPSPAKRGLVVLDGSLEGLPQLLDVRATGSRQARKPFDGRSTGRRTESLPVHGNSQNEKFQQSTLRDVCQPNRIPYRCPCVASAARLALEPSISNLIRPGMSATTTTSHGPDQHKSSPVWLDITPF